MKEHITLIDVGELPSRVQALREAGARLVTMVGTDERETNGYFALRYVFQTAPGEVETLLVPVEPANPVFPSVTLILPAAHWYEREVQDMLGLVPEGHPDPRPLVLHDPWPQGYYPLRKDFTPPPRDLAYPANPAYTPVAHPRVVGEGTISIPVGPIHAGIIEPGHFRFGAVGETVLHLEGRLFFTHRGLEKQLEGKDLDEGLSIAERICGVCSVSHAASYCEAVEAALGLEIPRRAAYLRTFYLELERLYNHIGDVGNVCAGVGFAFGVSNGSRLKERLQRLNRELSGHRFLRQTMTVGGVRSDLTPEKIQRIKAVLAEVEAEFKAMADVIFGNTSVVDRFAATGVLSPAAVRDLGVVGVGARASGVALDARREFPHAAYADIPFDIITEKEGDVLARVRVRVAEIAQSLAIVRYVLASLPEGDTRLPLHTVAAAAAASAGRTGMGVTESPRGENVHWVMIGPGGRIARLRVRTASFTNWPAVPLTVPGNIVPDFPLINKSFELCYSCCDR